MITFQAILEDSTYKDLGGAIGKTSSNIIPIPGAKVLSPVLSKAGEHIGEKIKKKNNKNKLIKDIEREYRIDKNETLKDKFKNIKSKKTLKGKIKQAVNEYDPLTGEIVNKFL